MNPQSGYQQAAVYWRERAELAEAELADIKQEALASRFAVRAKLNCTDAVAAIVVSLARHGMSYTTNDQLWAAMPRTRGGDGEKLLHVFIHQVRRAFKRAGIASSVTTWYGHGYALTQEAQTFLSGKSPASHLTASLHNARLGPDDAELKRSAA